MPCSSAHGTVHPRPPVPSVPAGMGDHFVLMVDRLLTESTLGAAIESGNAAAQTVKVRWESDDGEHPDAEDSPHQLGRRRDEGGDAGASCGEGKVVECRICQDEDQEGNMETPCSCSGSLKYAHRKCVQRWCDEKGDTICEICLQQFKPGYVAPPQLFHYGGSPMHFRGNWEISRQDLNNPHLLAMVTAGRGYSDTGYYDDYGSSRNMIYCRIVAIIFMALLVLRHALPIILSGDEYSFTLFAVMVLRVAGILVPVYVMIQALQVFHKRRRQQAAPALPVASSESEDELMHPSEQRQHHHHHHGRPASPLQARPHIIRVQ